MHRSSWLPSPQKKMAACSKLMVCLWTSQAPEVFRKVLCSVFYQQWTDVSPQRWLVAVAKNGNNNLSLLLLLPLADPTHHVGVRSRAEFPPPVTPTPRRLPMVTHGNYGGLYREETQHSCITSGVSMTTMKKGSLLTRSGGRLRTEEWGPDAEHVAVHSVK